MRPLRLRTLLPRSHSHLAAPKLCHGRAMTRFPFPLVAALAVSLAASLTGCRRATPAIQGAQGNIALARLDGAPVKLADYGRKVTVIALWNAACVPCLKELPHLDELAQSYAGDPDVAIFAVNVTDELPVARETVAKLGLKVPVLSDPKGELTNLLSPKVLAMTQRMPKSRKAHTACSRLEPQPKLRPATKILASRHGV